MRQTIQVEDYADEWFHGERNGRLAILGGYGTGKSWFCLRLTKRLADQYRADRKSGLPLLITFKRFEPGMDLESLIRVNLFDSYGVRVENLIDLRRGLTSGLIVPILDGLDEMGKALGERTALVAYSRLGLAADIPKVLITCRTQYFQSGSEQREILGPPESGLTFGKPPHFDVLHLKMLDQPKLHDFIGQRFEPSKATEIIGFVESTYNLSELCARPVLLSLVCESYDLLPSVGPVQRTQTQAVRGSAHLARASSSTDLYEAYIDAWLHREMQQGRLFIEPDSVKMLFEDLAQDMVNKDVLVVDSAILKAKVAALVKDAKMPRYKWKELERQILTSTFMSRSGPDGWQFAHQSFQEYFYARKFFRWEASTGGSDVFPVIHTPIWQFIALISLRKWDEKKALFWVKPRIGRQEEPTLTLTTLRAAAAYWLLKNDLPVSRLPLSGIMLDSVDLTELNLGGVDLSYSDFHASDLSGSDLTSAKLDHAVLESTQFLGANLQNASLGSSDISLADFREADFGPKGSTVWANTLNQLRGCHGWKTAIFDQEVYTLLKGGNG